MILNFSQTHFDEFSREWVKNNTQEITVTLRLRELKKNWQNDILLSTIAIFVNFTLSK